MAKIEDIRQRYDFDRIAGDTSNAIEFTIDSDLTDAEIYMSFRRDNETGEISLTLDTESEGGITIVDSGTFQVDEFIMTLDPSPYFYSIRIVYANGRIKSPIYGTMTVYLTPTLIPE